MSKEHQLAQALQQVAVVTEQLESVSQEREILLRTTEMYEMEKRELQDEVMISNCIIEKTGVYRAYTDRSTKQKLFIITKNPRIILIYATL